MCAVRRGFKHRIAARRRAPQTSRPDWFAYPFIGAELRNPDFVKLAESLGMAGCRVATPAKLRGELDRSFDRDAPALIEVTLDPRSEVSPWEFLMPAPRNAS